MNPTTRNTATLIYSALLFIGFFVSGVIGILDYLIVKAILFIAFALLAFYLFNVIFKDSERKNHLE